MTQTLFVDAGNGGTNAIAIDATGKRHKTYFASVRSTVTGNKVGFKEMELEFGSYKWGAHEFVVGDDVIKVTKRGLERHMGVNRYGNEFQAFLISVAAQRCKLKSGDVDLTLFAPPGMYGEVQPLMIKNFEGLQVEIIPSAGKPLQYTFRNVRVLPEGIGAVICLGFDENGQPYENGDLMRGRVIVIDSGTYTLDVMNFESGKLNQEPLPKSTWSDGGIAVHIIEPIVRMLQAHNPDFNTISHDDVDATIRNGLNGGDWQISAGVSALDIEAVYQAQCEKFAGWIANNIIDTHLNRLDGVTRAIMIGGGAVMAGEFLNNWSYGDKLVNYKKTPSLKKVHPVDVNIEGAYRNWMRQAASAKRK